MTREEVLNSDTLKRRFIKDCNLPIALTDNPYFLERLHTCNLITNATQMFEVFCEYLYDFDNEQEYFEHYNQIKDVAIERIKNSKGYHSFCGANFDNFYDNNKYPKCDLYKDYNNNELFVSIDMKKANFSALNHYDPTIFEDVCGKESETWEDFISQFTWNEHIINSKYIRQVIMGNCNPKSQIKYQDYLMNCLANYLKKIFAEINIYSVKNDEILINVGGKCSFSMSDLNSALKEEPIGLGKMVKAELFELKKVADSAGWLKLLYLENKTEFKCFDVNTINQYIKEYFNIPLLENDLVFRHNGRLAKYLEGVDKSWLQSISQTM